MNPAPLIAMRLSNGRDCSIPFSACSQRALIIECQGAWRSFRAQLANSPEYFTAQQQLNSLHQTLLPDLDGRNKADKIAQWCQRGHSPDAAEVLWRRLQENRKMQLSNAKRRLQGHCLPDYLELHVNSVITPDRRWWHPLGAVGGVRIRADMNIEAHTQAGNRVWSWHELWAAIRKIDDGERQLIQLGSWVSDQVTQLTTPARPHLSLVQT